MLELEPKQFSLFSKQLALLKKTFILDLQELQQLAFYPNNLAFWLFCLLMWAVLSRFWGIRSAFSFCFIVSVLLLAMTQLELIIAPTVANYAQSLIPVTIKLLAGILIFLVFLYYAFIKANA